MGLVEIVDLLSFSMDSCCFLNRISIMLIVLLSGSVCTLALQVELFG